MTNEMMRPCTLWGETFDAMRVKIVEIYMATSSEPFQVWVEIWEENPDGTTPITHKKCFSENEIIIANREDITTIADALNAPVLASPVVMKDLPKDAKAFILVNHESNGIHTQMKCFLYWGFKDKREGWMYREHDLDSLDGESYDYLVSKSDKLYADDSKTAEYLRQFTLKGKRIKQKEMN